MPIDNPGVQLTGNGTINSIPTIVDQNTIQAPSSGPFTYTTGDTSDHVFANPRTGRITFGSGSDTQGVGLMRNDVDTLGILQGGSSSVLGKLKALSLESTVTTGTAPLTVASTTVVSNLNADLLDGNQASVFAQISGTPADNQVGVWTGATALEGSSVFTFDGTNLKISTASAGGSTVDLTAVNTTTDGASRLVLGNDSDASIGRNQAFGSTFTSDAYRKANGVTLESRGAGGLVLASTNAAGQIFFVPGGTTERAKFLAAGHLVLNELTTNPGTTDLTSDAAIAVYTKADTLVIAYNNAGTITYITIPLDGSTTTWTHGTAAP